MNFREGLKMPDPEKCIVEFKAEVAFSQKSPSEQGITESTTPGFGFGPIAVTITNPIDGQTQVGGGTGNFTVDVNADPSFGTTSGTTRTARASLRNGATVVIP